VTDAHPVTAPHSANEAQDPQDVALASPWRDGTELALPEPADLTVAFTGGVASSGQAQPVLRLLNPHHRQQDYSLVVAWNTLGRLPDNDVVLTSPFVSRRHCAIRVLADGGCFMQDLGSKDGVYVNGERIKRRTGKKRRKKKGTHLILYKSKIRCVPFFAPLEE
jgi:pSer/pThr/pTyr-binding forkhead associated (FHA) protein